MVQGGCVVVSACFKAMARQLKLSLGSENQGKLAMIRRDFAVKVMDTKLKERLPRKKKEPRCLLEAQISRSPRQGTFADA